MHLWRINYHGGVAQFFTVFCFQKIAQRFNAGVRYCLKRSPVRDDRTNHRYDRFCRPSRDSDYRNRVPSVKTLGYFLKANTAVSTRARVARLIPRLQTRLGGADIF